LASRAGQIRALVPSLAAALTLAISCGIGWHASCIALLGGTQHFHCGITHSIPIAMTADVLKVEDLAVQLLRLSIYSLGLSGYMASALSFTLSIVLGMLVSMFIENYFLAMRDKKFLRRIAIASYGKQEQRPGQVTWAPTDTEVGDSMKSEKGDAQKQSERFGLDLV
jgi:uncharacterized membrane protein